MDIAMSNVVQKVAYGTTTNATATTLTNGTVAIAELAGAMIKAEVMGMKSDGTAGAWVTKEGGYRRASGGNITLIGSVNGTTQEDSAGTPAINLVINTSASPQVVEVQVTGIAAETWNWTALIEVMPA